MRSYFGYRFWIVASVSLSLAMLWVYISLPNKGSPDTLYASFAEGAAYMAAMLIGLLWQRWIGLLLRTRIEKIPYIIYVLLGWGGVLYTAWHGYTLYEWSGQLSYSELKWGIGVYLVAPLFLAFYRPFYIYIHEWTREVSFFQQFGEILGGSARWGTVRSFSRLRGKLKQSLFSLSWFKDQGVRGKRVILGQATLADHPFTPLVGVNDDSNLVTTGIIGSGKSISAIWLTLLSYLGSVIVFDPAGEHTALTFERRCSRAFLKTLGIRSKVKKHFKNAEARILDPFGASPYASSCYSFLSEINPDAPNARKLIEVLADGIIDSESQANKWIEDEARAFLQGVMCHVLTKYPKEYHTLPFCLDLIYGKDPELGVASVANFNKLLVKMSTNPAMDGLAQEGAVDIMKAGEKQRGTVLTTVSKNLKWCGDREMRTHISKSDFSLADFGLRKTPQGKPIIETLYIILPDSRAHEMSRWMRTLASLSVAFMKERRKEAVPKIPTLFILDEFAMLGGRIKSISDGYATLRKYGVRLWIFLQSLQQLQTMFKDRWSDMLANSNIQILSAGMGDPTTLKYASEALGFKIVQRTERRRGSFGRFRRRRVIAEASRELLTPSEVATKLSKTEDAQLVFGSLSKHPLRLRQVSFKRLRIRGNLFKGIGRSGFRAHYGQSSIPSVIPPIDPPKVEQQPKLKPDKPVPSKVDLVTGNADWFSEN